eukprot:TRINITY_DN2312_c0_g1::TRINITY_DN2312_c0_g1_i1::g.20736::m.20736 TRINITY_DN2312_c0_g1::TRINITY_DN2312_c0_g1_i1::g.20736  ORF type:complete len:481 (-),score=184.29,sp/Q553V1/CISYM_DICDI/63.53/0.0,Citrate_synt/PF00285.16/1.4e-103 TRINITY_DN2312_c0_g1_i1:440-1882(-)
MALSLVRSRLANQALRQAAPAAFQATRAYSTEDISGLKARFRELVPSLIDEKKQVIEAVGNEILGACSVEQAYGGMRGVKSLITETSLLDPNEGIRYRGLSLFEIRDKLPRAQGGEEPLPEATFWLLLTGEIPTADQTKRLTEELHHRSKLPKHVVDLIHHMPKFMHPMSKLSAAVLALQTESHFAKAYEKGVHKSRYWEFFYDDALNLIAKLPEVAALIYRTTFHNDSTVHYDNKLDWGANYAHMLGFDDKHFQDLMRLYLVIHADHEGGNVSAHTTHLVGSALSDCYLSLSAGLNGLAGPLHGLANQEVLRFLLDVKHSLGSDEPTPARLTEEVQKVLNSGRVVPGYGHAVLRKTDPRYTVQREFALKYLPNDELFKLVSTLYEVVPDILQKTGKVKNPWPNVDAHSGAILHHYGLTEMNYYTVLFGVSRALGVLPSLVLDRALNLPIERPKSVTTAWIKKNFKWWRGGSSFADKADA